MRLGGRRAAVLLSVAALLAVMVPPFINVNRYRARLAETLSRSISRPVTMGRISLRMLPTPRFVIQNLVVGDDPAFGAEPMLTSEEVTASLRTSSLWRGRLEIAKLSFKYPSLNLVRDEHERWNLESLLNTAKQVPSAPTTKKQAETRPRFPYIESDSGRINLKIGMEKKAFALVDADFAFWQESENQWKLRLEARPIRTDANLGDTGTLNVEGSLERAPELRSSPVKLRVEVRRAQLGQFTHFVQGEDKGWRGGLNLLGEVQGTAEELNFHAEAKVDDFRRYDLAISEPLSLTAKCDGRWYGVARRQQTRSADPEFATVECRSPLGDGAVLFDASVTHGGGWRLPNHRLVISKVPMAAVGTILRHAKGNLPADFAMAGSIDGDFHCEGTCDPETPWRGGAMISDAAVSSRELSAELHVPNITLAYTDVKRKERRKKDSAPALQVLSVLPLRIAIGATGGADVSGDVSQGKLTLLVKGSSDLPALLSTARLLGLRATKSQLTGGAQFDLILSTAMDLAQPQITGSARLQAVSARVPGMAAPLEIASADVLLGQETVALRNLRGDIARTHSAFDGSVLWHRCDAAPCTLEFDLHATELDLADINRLLNPSLRASSWKDLPKRLFGDDSGRAGSFPAMKADGSLHLDRFVFRSLVVTRVLAKVNYADRVLRAHVQQAETAGGSQSAEWTADLSRAMPEYQGSGTLRGANAATLGQLVANNYASGKIDVQYEISLAGADAAALAQSAVGNAGFHWTNGVLQQVQVGRSPLQFKSWAGKLEFANSAATLLPGTLQTAQGEMGARGRVTFSREAELVFADDSQQITVAGPLEKPKVSVRRTQAASNTTDAETNPKQ